MHKSEDSTFYLFFFPPSDLFQFQNWQGGDMARLFGRSLLRFVHYWWWNWNEIRLTAFWCSSLPGFHLSATVFKNFTFGQAPQIVLRSSKMACFRRGSNVPSKGCWIRTHPSNLNQHENGPIKHTDNQKQKKKKKRKDIVKRNNTTAVKSRKQRRERVSHDPETSSSVLPQSGQIRATW